MPITDTFVLPDDVVVEPISKLAKNLRDEIEHNPDDWTISRRHSRTPSRVINADLAALLNAFVGGKSIVDAVIDYSRGHGKNPNLVLEEALPSLQRFILTNWLVPYDSHQAGKIKQSLETGDSISDYCILECIQILENTELYKAVDPQGGLVALKLARLSSNEDSSNPFRRESDILKCLDGEPSPQWVAEGVDKNYAYLCMEWCSGAPVTVLADELRHVRKFGSSKKLRELCCLILRGYSRLHEKGVVHGDVHPGNIFIEASERIKIIDFDLATGLTTKDRVRRGGVGSFFDPEYAEALRTESRLPAADMASDQYALAALLYQLLTGRTYLAFAPTRDEMLRQIAEDPPLAFSDQDVPSWPDLEAVLGKALSKRAEDRYVSVGEFHNRLAKVSIPKGLLRPDIRTDVDSFCQYVDRLIVRFDPENPVKLGAEKDGPLVSVNFGEAGIAYAMYRIAGIRGDARILSMADFWITRARSNLDSENAFYVPALDISEESVGRISPYHTRSGVYLTQAIIAQALGDFVTCSDAIERYLQACNDTCNGFDLTLGRTSILMGGALLIEAMENLPDILEFGRQQKAVLDQGNEALATIWRHLSGLPSITDCKEIVYFGIAHGWAGLCFGALQWCALTGQPWPAELENRLEQLADLAEPFGEGVRWPVHTQYQRGKQTYMSSWCNGAPGTVHLWILAYHQLRDSKFLELAEKAAWIAWKQRDDIGSICCGYAGRAYALAAFYRLSSDRIWLDRAIEICGLASRCESNFAMPNSLYKGELGVGVLTSDLSSPEHCRLPFFELEGSIGKANFQTG